MGRSADERSWPIAQRKPLNVAKNTERSQEYGRPKYTERYQEYGTRILGLSSIIYRIDQAALQELGMTITKSTIHF